MSFFVGIAGALAFLAILLAAATFVPKYFKNSKASGPDAGSDAAAGGGYGSYGMNDFSGDAGGGDGD